MDSDLLKTSFDELLDQVVRLACGQDGERQPSAGHASKRHQEPYNASNASFEEELDTDSTETFSERLWWTG